MVKMPRPGRVKTRLAEGIGRIPAVWWYRHQVARLLRRIEDRRWQLILAVSPDAEGLASRVWPEHLARIPQRLGDLGSRMKRLLATFAPDPTIIIGSDIPAIRRRHVADAFARLARADAVLGPTPDGGYWLIGTRRRTARAPGFLTAVRWSTHHARADTLTTLAPARVAKAAMLADVDTKADL